MDKTDKIQLLSPADTADIYRLECSSFREPWSEQAVREAFAYPGARVGGLFLGTELKGYYFAGAVLDEGELMNLCVEKAFRRRGAGRALLQHMEEQMREQQVRFLYLEVRSQNLPARQLYHSQGYREIGLRPGYYGDDDAILMKKEIDRVSCI